jgi:diguanylate cyclase (GGDEF)-like protein
MNDTRAYDAALAASYEATRELLYAGDRDDALDIMVDFVAKLGGELVDATSIGDEDMQVVIDLDDRRLAAVARDRTSLRRLQRHLPTVGADAQACLRLIDLAHAADIDVLTGLPNRRAANRIIPRLRSGDCVAVIDLDHFKAVNDTWGHEGGDRVLAAFGQLLVGRSRVSDRYLRVGGEEFLGVFHAESVGTAAAAMRHLARQWRRAAPHPCTFSAGVAAVVGDDGLAAWRLADERVFEAKELGRNRVLAG